MKITFHGATKTVTGSKHLITLDNGKNILLDCGMYQGLGAETINLNYDFGFNPQDINYVILSHAHIDHSGLIPKLVRNGFNGRIFATPATIDLAEILLLNSAHIQEHDAAYVNKIRRNENKKPVKPLYSHEDVKHAIPLFEPVEYKTPYFIDDDIEIQFFDVGHIIGSATTFLKLKEKNKTVSIVFSGDVGRYGDPVLKSPQRFPQADYIIIESTYGNKLHDDVDSYSAKLKEHIIKTCIEKRGKLIIPAFSAGRTQELLFALNELELNGELPDVECFVDSPLSIEATEVVKKHAKYFNKNVQKLFLIDNDVFDFKGLRYIKTVEESKKLNSKKEPCIIISASGMADAGRVKHHIANSISEKRNTILIVGYCEANSLGARLKQHPDEVGIFGEKFKVKADIEEINSMSAHADYGDLSQYLACQNYDLVKTIFIVHGEPDVQQEFKRRLMKKGFHDVVIPELHQSFVLK
ncbi:MAG: MBL fold metallo-hydrolase [Prevotellaceae bacterium]|jgi:metallo-beta-lactamase family protein|nr:MBL fold metallo-hydrolase [Prevotellaceae bacterium]